MAQVTTSKQALKLKLKRNYFLQAGFDVRRSYLDSAKYRNALHELVLNYAAIHPAERPAKLHHKFIDILAVLLQSGLDINDADDRSVFHSVYNTVGDSRVDLGTQPPSSVGYAPIFL